MSFICKRVEESVDKTRERSLVAVDHEIVRPPSGPPVVRTLAERGRPTFKSNVRACGVPERPTYRPLRSVRA